jgi:hypothetical protein
MQRQPKRTGENERVGKTVQVEIVSPTPRTYKTRVRVTHEQPRKIPTTAYKIVSGAKVPVSTRAIIQRINRVLVKDGRQVKTARSIHVQLDCGKYFVIDVRNNAISRHDVSLEELATVLEVLQPYEEIRD